MAGECFPAIELEGLPARSCHVHKRSTVPKRPSMIQTLLSASSSANTVDSLELGCHDRQKASSSTSKGSGCDRIAQQVSVFTCFRKWLLHVPEQADTTTWPQCDTEDRSMVLLPTFVHVPPATMERNTPVWLKQDCPKHTAPLPDQRDSSSQTSPEQCRWPMSAVPVQQILPATECS